MTKQNPINAKISRWQRIRQYQPTTKLVKLILLWWLIVVFVTAVKLTDGFGLSVLTDATGMAFIGCKVIVAILAVVCILDILLLKAISQADSYRLQREYPSNVAIFHQLDITVLLSFIPEKLHGMSGALFASLANFGKKNIHVEFYDDYPSQLQLLQPMPLAVTIELEETSPLFDDSIDDNNQEIAQGYSKKIVYPTQPIERGTAYFGSARLRVASPFGFFRRQLAIEQSEDSKHTDHYLRVLADFTGLLSNELSAVFERGFDAGIQTIKEEGQGSEFLKIREYAVGDSMRQIDWKASSRQGRIMSKSYEDENDQDVVFLLDCSEQMRHKKPHNPQSNMNASDELSYFDKVLNAVLLLSYVANKQGDRVGLMTFGGASSNINVHDANNNSDEELFIIPQKGAGMIRRLLNATADTMPTMQTSDYYKASESLNKSIKKRSLVIVITNTRQEASDELIQAMKSISRKHQLVFANLTEQSVQDVLNQQSIPADMDEALLYHSLTNYQQTRDKLHKKLSQQTGAMCIATTANKLPLLLTQAYLSARN